MSTIAAAVRVGVACFVTSVSHPRSVLVGVRQGSHGAGKLALPGGHLELGESWEECATREVEEETNLKIEGLKYVYATNDPNIDNNPNKHYITIFMHASVSPTSPPLQTMEPHKCEGWKWIPWTELVSVANDSPEILFDPMLHFIHGNGQNVFASMLDTIE